MKSEATKKTMSISLEKLEQFVARLESLEEQKASVMEDFAETMAEARGEGFDVKILRQVLRIRKMKPEDRNEQEELINLYMSALR